MLYLYWALVVIIILLLNAIGAKQKVKIKELSKIRLVYIFTKTISACFLQEIYIKVYIYILILLELLVSKRFYKIFINPTFRAHVGLVVINKVYLMVNQGGSFQSLYTQLWKVWLLLRQKPQFACTVILNNIIFRIIQELAGF